MYSLPSTVRAVSVSSSPPITFCIFLLNSGLFISSKFSCPTVKVHVAPSFAVVFGSSVSDVSSDHAIIGLTAVFPSSLPDNRLGKTYLSTFNPVVSSFPLLYWPAGSNVTFQSSVAINAALSSDISKAVPSNNEATYTPVALVSCLVYGSFDFICEYKMFSPPSMALSCWRV